MCGIYAIFGAYDREEAIACAETIQHRGPDNTVYCPVPHGFVGFHRLSIMDTSSLGNQPFCGSTWTLMCNGEIYNANELRQYYGIHTLGNSDCEVIFQLLEQKKLTFSELIQKIYGVYSIVAIERLPSENTRVYIARDPVGVRPLFWVQTVTNLIIASEPCALKSYGSLVRVFEPDTALYISINEAGVPSSNGVVLKSPNLCTPFPTTISNLNFAVRTVSDAMENVVRRRLMSDRPMACYLSGGVDSSSIAALVSKFSSSPIHTFSIGLEGSTDLVFARAVAKHLGTIHHEIIKTEQEFIDAIPDVIFAIQSYDVTTVRASTPMYLLSEYIAKNTDFKVVFSGEGPDEVCGSYMYFHASPGPEASADECRRLVSHMHYFDVLRSDRCTARWGLEVRVPFLGVDFIRSYWSIDPNLRVPLPRYTSESKNRDPTSKPIEKWILRKAVEDLLPEEVCWRPKEAFSDGVSAKTRSWSVILQEYTDTKVSDEELQNARRLYPHHTPKTKEGFWMRKLYSNYYPHMENLIPYQWLPKWVGNVQDPSARVLDVYNKK